MCKLFFKQIILKEEKKGTFANEVRKYAKTVYITPARQRGDKTATFSASDLHEGLKYKNRFPLVCGAIDAKKFCEFARVKLAKRSGPRQSATTRWTFEV